MRQYLPSLSEIQLKRLFMCASREMERSPWICHVCSYKSSDTASKACDLCYRVTCSLHLRPASIYNPNNGLFETAAVCFDCAIDNAKNKQ
jgi:hypothetical protein